MASPKNLFSDLSHGHLVFVNVFGEPFFSVAGTVIKVNPETGEKEEVGPAANFDVRDLDDYWTGASLKEEWESVNGSIALGHFLVPITPFTLGGEFVASNLMMLSEAEAASFYSNIRKTIQGLPDGSTVTIEVKP